MMANEMFRVLWRGIRTSVAIGAGAFLASLMEQPLFIIAAPVFNAVFKAIRDKFPKLWWIPL
jgi:uncharacterized membrane protein YgaE (UPF0421/DUF939 family)